MACRNCGAALAANERFCRNCGAEAHSDELPPVEDAWAAPVQTGGPPPRRERSRPGWLIPAVIAGGLLVGAAVVGLLVLGSGGSGSRPKALTEQAAPILQPVTSGLTSLSGKLGKARSKDELPAAGADAAALAAKASTAAARIRALKLNSDDRTAAQLLAFALDQTQAYSNAVATAAAKPGAGTVAAVARTAGVARTAFGALASTVPELALPAGSAFAVIAVTHGSTGAGPAAYVAQIDRLLTTSARTRKNLGDLISGVSGGSLPADAAATQAQAIVVQRTRLARSVASVRAPAAFRRPAALLTASLAAALADDRQIQSWALSRGQGDTVGADLAWRRHLAATTRATAAKAAFVEAYDAARKRALGLGPFPVGDGY